MTSYMTCDSTDKDFDPGYTKDEIDRCEKIIDAFLISLDGEDVARNSESILKIVKNVVLELNDLNDECDGSLIETGQREQLCDIIIRAANEAGLATDDDITEEWREW